MSEETVKDTTVTKCNCGRICSVCQGMKRPDKLSIAKGNFWDLWVQKLFRNLASMKFQWMTILCAVVVWGMYFKTMPGTTPPTPYISAELGLGFLGGGFITLATSRLIARTKLTEPSNGDLDTDK
jgi:drug/metabolite transporter (DMT)-like permease